MIHLNAPSQNYAVLSPPPPPPPPSPPLGPIKRINCSKQTIDDPRQPSPTYKAQIVYPLIQKIIENSFFLQIVAVYNF